MKEITIKITEVQAKALLNLIDIAVKTGGLQVASTAVFFVELIRTAAKSSDEIGTVDSNTPG